MPVLAFGTQQKAHPIVFKWSLTTANQDARIKVFWYNQPVSQLTRIRGQDSK